MPTLVELGHLLVATRVTTSERWQRAAKVGAGKPTKILDALATHPPEWWTGPTAGGS